ncbi:triose-phosphate isomerase [Pseudohongiella sp.]|uniref:triose-phosphate isomerase n=1 Tax=marine sediment metagenome TaxID=412755 RepID=A0A0F9YQE7_9ZZZZ|nr:triose-phosphate isomerase [Pseudohongiella sp.]HDZ10122.1 triose-phosphate isomerase [Pseudohongiella sp.]HEA63471.1 triose-phosphate isomerase [Pseudohongiella sp.]
MRRALVVGNWKMNGTRDSIQALLRGLVPAVSHGINGVDIVVCPPFPYLALVAETIKGCEIVLGAQNVSCEEKGAFTGEISPGMLVDCRARYVILGHSERRQQMAETDELIARKFVAAQQAGLIPILCVGETLAQRDNGSAQATVAAQVSAVLTLAGVTALERAVIAYEPVWAIGTGKSATAQQAQQMHAGIRELIAGHDAEVAGAIQLLYGGSVSSANAAELFEQADIDGGLVGGASLDASAFIEICNSVS